MLCVYGDLLSLSSNSRACRTMLFSFLLAPRNLKVFNGIITNYDGCIFQNYSILIFVPDVPLFPFQAESSYILDPPIQFGHHHLHHMRSLMNLSVQSNGVLVRDVYVEGNFLVEPFTYNCMNCACFCLAVILKYFL